VRSGPGGARTILLFHTISARPSKQPPVLAKNPAINHTGNPSIIEGFFKTAMVRTVGFRAQLIANHCSFLMGMRGGLPAGTRTCGYGGEGF
jgi:hypothetical protein